MINPMTTLDGTTIYFIFQKTWIKVNNVVKDDVLKGFDGERWYEIDQERLKDWIEREELNVCFWCGFDSHDDKAL